jgi:hypothetical protein
LPGPSPAPLPNPDPSMYPPLTPGQYQVMNGARQATVACLEILVACAFPPEGAVATVGWALSVQSNANDLVIGTTNFYAGTTGQTQLGQTTEQTLNAYGTPARALGTAVLGSPQGGENLNNIVNGAFSLGDLPALVGGSIPSAIKGVDAGLSVGQGVNALQNVLPSQPPNGSNAGVSPQPKPPNQSPASPQGSGPVPQPAPTPAPAPTPNPPSPQN